MNTRALRSWARNLANLLGTHKVERALDIANTPTRASRRDERENVTHSADSTGSKCCARKWEH
eukprot:6473363-Amphidinium_carterae.5